MLLRIPKTIKVHFPVLEVSLIAPHPTNHTAQIRMDFHCFDSSTAINSNIIVYQMNDFKCTWTCGDMDQDKINVYHGLELGLMIIHHQQPTSVCEDNDGFVNNVDEVTLFSHWLQFRAISLSHLHTCRVISLSHLHTYLPFTIVNINLFLQPILIGEDSY